MKKIDIACIIDDDPIYIFGVKKVIEMVNVCDRILVFHNGKDAFDKLNALFSAGEKLPELILLDLNMPVWDGWQFLDEFIKTPLKEHIIIWIVSSSVDPADIERAKSYDAVRNFIVKPITLEKMKELFKI